MKSADWAHLSDWHNAWLAADPTERDRLRRSLSEQHPDLAGEADGLAEASHVLPVFLETPAFALAIRDLADDEPELTMGASIGPYRILRLLAPGGMGDVYRATDVRLGRDVALKLLAKRGSSDSQEIERFLQEARVTASLDHPNVVKVFDVGVFDERPYLVAELLDGETLRERISRGPLAPEQVRQIAVQVAKGLVAAHAAGLVHRDLKPENIFLTRSDVTKILDFGIAKLNPQGAGHDDVATLTHVVLGTAGYLAPEQIRGEPVDGRTDLFALGAILFEMLTGARPFARQHTIDTLHAILHEPTPMTLAEMADVPASLTAIVTRLLEKAPTGRFQSAADLMWALEQVAGTRLAYQSGRFDRRQLSIVASDGTGIVLPCPGSYCEPTDWSADGQRLIVNVRAETSTDVWAVAISPGGSSQPILAESFTERDARLSPDDQWIAYVSEESGRPEVSVRNLSGPPRRFVILRRWR